MGCDIHLYVEKRTEKGWEVLKGKNPLHENFKDEPEFGIRDWLYDGRNYSLFAILARVRNRSNLKPISEPRGIPNDASPAILKEKEDWGSDGHSHSWYTFKELLDFDWEGNTVNHEGFVTEAVYKHFKETGDPYPCSEDVHGPRIEKVLNYVMDRIIANKYPWEYGKEFYTALHWKTTYGECAEELLENIKSFIKEKEIIDPQNYRIVFWFDN